MPGIQQASIRPQYQIEQPSQTKRAENKNFSTQNMRSSVTNDTFSHQSPHFGAVTQILHEITDPISLRALQEEYDSRGPDPHFVIDGKIYEATEKDAQDLSRAKHHYYNTWKGNWESAYAMLTGTYRFLAKKAKE